MAIEQINDVLDNPCPQCAIKHLSAALYHNALIPSEPDPGWSYPKSVYVKHVAIATINLIEVLTGYRSHLWYAVGALVRAEEYQALVSGTTENVAARKARLLLEERGLDGVRDALAIITNGAPPTHQEWAEAHLCEARRELPEYAGYMKPEYLQETIDAIWSEFFDLPRQDNGKEVNKMAVKTVKKAAPVKAAAKKAPAKKATQAACKGGKAKKGCK